MPAPIAPTEPDTARRFGRYRILKELGRGAMGVVHLAEDPALGRRLAIKTITLPSDARERAEYEARFLQEARAAGALNHPNIITVHDVGRENDVAYMALELLDGVELGKLMAQRRLPLAMTLDIGAQIAEGLAFAHAAGVVHRDIKPANIMLVRGTQVKIMDFGIARMRQSDIRTQTGVMLGSPRYMSPEQVSGEAIDHRSDIFTLGVLLYEMASGLPPFTGTDFFQLIVNIASEPHKPLNRVIPGLPDRLTAIVDRTLQKDRNTRYQDAAELAADLRALKARVDAAGQSGGSLPPDEAPFLTAPAASASVASASVARTQRLQTSTVAMNPAVPAANLGTATGTARLPAVDARATRASRGLPATSHYELPHERDLRLALEAQRYEPEPEPEEETPWGWVTRYGLGIVVALALGIVLGELSLFKRTELSSHDLSAAELARFLGLSGALVLLTMAALKAADRLREQSGGAHRIAGLLVPFTALFVSAAGYRVALIVAVPALSSRARGTMDWLFVLAIAGAALWCAYALIRQSDKMASTLTAKFRFRSSARVCAACGARDTGRGRHCVACGAPWQDGVTNTRSTTTKMRSTNGRSQGTTVNAAPVKTPAAGTKAQPSATTATASPTRRPGATRPPAPRR